MHGPEVTFPDRRSNLGVVDPAVPARSSALVLYRPLVEKLIAALGALIVHQVAYFAAPGLTAALGVELPEAADHSHLSTQWAVVAPLAVVATAGFVIWQIRGFGFRSALSWRYLGGLVGGFFLVQEVIEGAVSGHSIASVLTHPAVLLGLVLAPLIGWVLSRALSGVTELARRLLSPPTPTPKPAKTLWPNELHTLASAFVGGCVRSRAPPVPSFC